MLSSCNTVLLNVCNDTTDGANDRILNHKNKVDTDHDQNYRSNFHFALTLKSLEIKHHEYTNHSKQNNYKSF